MAGRDFIRYPAGMSIAGAVVCTGYFCPGRTFDAHGTIIGLELIRVVKFIKEYFTQVEMDKMDKMKRAVGAQCSTAFLFAHTLKSPSLADLICPLLYEQYLG